MQRLTSHEQGDGSPSRRSSQQVPWQWVAQQVGSLSDVGPGELDLEAQSRSPDSGSQEEDNQA